MPRTRPIGVLPPDHPIFSGGPHFVFRSGPQLPADELPVESDDSSTDPGSQLSEDEGV